MSLEKRHLHGCPRDRAPFLSEVETLRFRRMTVIWGITVLLLLPVLAALGYFMRLYQSDAFPKIKPEWFYAVLTLHSLGMVGAWFVGSMAGVSYPATQIHTPEPTNFKTQLWGHPARRGSTDCVHVGRSVRDWMVFPLSPTALTPSIFGARQLPLRSLSRSPSLVFVGRSGVWTFSVR